MELLKTLHLALTLIYGMLLFNAIASAQSGDRILTFDSKIIVAKNRALHVDERFEVANDMGFFDNGLHRRLRIKPSGPQRAKPGSFQSIRAKVDGHDALVRTTEDKDVFDVAISTETGSLSRGNHLIELSYAAKHQFLVYDDFEDLNQDISGEWPVTIDKATVELDFPGRLPHDTAISADTGSGSNFRFDCVRTELPSGVKFETSHAIPPNERLLISARFSRGYFVSDVKEEGFRAVLENHPMLYACAAFLVGLVVSTAGGFLVALVILKSLGSVLALHSDHRVATIIALVATLLSGGFAIAFRQFYTAMPGFMIGAYASILISGNPHGGEPFSLITIALASNFAFYYLTARGLLRIFPWKRISTVQR